MPRMFIFAGCNGAGKTTAAFSVLPAELNCKNFVNADEIAKGLSPFDPAIVAFEAGRIMLERIKFLIQQGEDFAFETTLATKSFRNLVHQARSNGYHVTLIFFWLNSPDIAVERVKYRVQSGGHFIPEDVIRRRYNRGLSNLNDIYKNSVDEIFVFDNSFGNQKLLGRIKSGSLVEGDESLLSGIIETDQFKEVNKLYDDEFKILLISALEKSFRNLLHTKKLRGERLVVMKKEKIITLDPEYFMENHSS